MGPELHFQNFGIIVTSVSAKNRKECENHSAVEGTEYSAHTVDTSDCLHI